VGRRLVVLVALVLALSACGESGGASVSRYGVSLVVPAGWHARVFRGAFAVSTRTPPARYPYAVLRHLGQDDIAVVLYEDTADSSWSPDLDLGTYRNGAPPPFAASELAKHHGHGRVFRLGGRLFDLFVSTGPHGHSTSRLAELNELVRSIAVKPGDFYPGRAAPAGFQPARGWFVHHQGSLAVGSDNFVVTVASTAPWSDDLNVTYPTQSLARLRRTHGVAILVSLEADNRYPPAARSVPLRFGPPGHGWVGDGPTLPGVQTRSGSGAVAREYGYGVTVVYGGAHPSERQRALARAELRRLVLPAWPRWPKR